MEEQKQNIEIQGSGLVCDNTSCDWEDKTIKFEDLKSWINKSCPKCGDNVLTEADFKSAEQMRLTVKIVNSLSEEDMKAIQGMLGGTTFDTLKDNPMFKDAEGIDTVKNEGYVQLTVKAHNGVKVTNIKNVEK